MSATKDILTIDLSEWMTQAKYAQLTGYNLNTISQWVKRAKEGQGEQKIDYKEIPELSITLVKKLL